jgi:RHS repeat-associated protein
MTAMSRTRKLLFSVAALLSVGASLSPLENAVAAPAPAVPDATLTPSFPAPMPALQSASLQVPGASPAAAPAPNRLAQMETAGLPPGGLGPASGPMEGWSTFTHWTSDGSGKVTLTTYTEPVFRHDAAGWHSTEATVSGLPGALGLVGQLGADQLALPMHFGTSSDRLLEMQAQGGTVTVSANGLAVGRPVRDGADVVYANAAPSTDLRYTIGATGVKEKLMLRDSSAPTTFTFHYSDPSHALGTVRALSGSEGVIFTNPVAPDAALELPAPFAYEPSKGSYGAAGSAHMAVLPAGDGWDVTLSVDQSWLQGRSFPIVLDPTNFVTRTIGGGFENPSDTAAVDYPVQYLTQSGSCGGNCFNGPGGGLLNDGTQWTDQTRTDSITWRVLLHFDLSSIPAGSYVSNAFVDLYNVDWVGAPEFASCPSPCATPTDLHTLTSAFPMGGTTFNWVNANTNAAWFSSINVCEGNYNNPCLNRFPAQGQAQAWVNGSPNNGMVARMQSESPTIGGPVWFANYYPTGSGIAVGHYPSMTVVFSPPPAAPLNVMAQAGNGSANVGWQAPTPNGGDQITGYTVTTYNSNGTVAQGGVQVGGNTYGITVNGLTNGNCYYFTVTATNDVGTGPAGTSPTVCLSAPPSLTKYLDPAQTGTLFENGQDVVYDVKVSNPQSDRTMTVNSVTDTLPAGLAAAIGSPVLEDGGACAICPAVSGNTITVNGFTLAPKGQAGDNHVFQYHTVAVGSAASGCTSVVNNASAANAYGTSTASVPITVCDNGLGVEQWWTYVTRALGPQGQALVNVANGNLVIQQADSTAIQGHGRLAYVLRRAYNSEDTGLLTVPGGFGRGWTLNIDNAGDSVGAGVSPSGLYVPSVQSLLNPMAVTLIDRDGTRHAFTPKGLVASSGSVPAFEVQSALTTSPSGLLATAAPLALRLDPGGGFNHICVDETYNAPPGVHLALWRYLEINSGASNPCASLSQASASRVLGFAAVRPDRVRYEFSWDGHMVDMFDGSGIDLRYLYSNGLPAAGSAFGDLVAVYEPRSCPSVAYPAAAPVSASVVPTYCRAFRFAYTTTVSGGAVTQTRVAATDPANRVTTYTISGTLLPSLSSGTLLPAGQLTQVTNPDGSTLAYTYGGCGGAPTQLCSTTDPRGHATTFGYWPAPSVGVAQLKTITDRNQSALGTPSSTTFTYGVACAATSNDCTLVDYGSERQRYRRIDAAARVGVIEAGDLSNNLYHQAFQTWDGNVDARVLENPPSPLPAVTTCRQDGVVDNDLCRAVRVAMNDSETGRNLGITTPDEDTRFVYNQEGGLLAQRQALGSGTLDATYGYQVEYFEASSGTPVRCFDDQVQGHGSVQTAVHSGCAAGTRNDSAALFAISDVTQVLPPRGNAATSNPDYHAFMTTYDIDNNRGVAPSQALAANAAVCIPNGVQYNTGLRCDSVTPSSDPNVAQSITRYQYDSLGQRTRMTTPLGGIYGYDYYGDSEFDVSGTTQAGGWLKAVTDPSGSFVAYAYDAAGNLSRSWDRNATQGHLKTDGWNLLSAPPSPTYSETLYGAGAGTAPYATPWRYALSQRDQVGDLVTFQLDANGNVLLTRPPRGNAGANTSSAYDVRATFDNNDNQLTKQMPLEAPAGQRWVYTYDLFNNRTASIDPNSGVSVAIYDVVNRQTGIRWTRGPWPADTTQVPSACQQSGAADSPIPSGRILCSTAAGYDGVDNTVTSQDGNHQTTTYTYDGVHRAIQRVVPRDASTSLYTKVVYDADGHVTDVCTPRQFTDGGTSPTAACPAGALYTTHSDYDTAGRQVASTTYRQQTDPSTGVTTVFTNVTRTGYDADGNPTSVTDPDGNTATTTYDLLDRKVQATVPRSSSAAFSTVYRYDPSGDVTAVIRPGSLDTGGGSSGTLVVDGSVGSNSSDGQVHGTGNPFVVPLGATYTSVTLQNGGWITAAPYDSVGDTGGVLAMSVSGSLSICPSCGVTMAGRGASGGAGAPATVNGSASGGSGVGPGRAGGSSVTAGGGGGGGGHAQSGTAGSSAPSTGAAGPGGSPYGSSDLSDTSTFGLAAHYGMGSGGGGGGSTALSNGGSGGAGGGFIRITANTIDDQGTIVADGSPGAPGAPGAVSATGGGGGGGGSAGSVWLKAFQVTLAQSNALSAVGGGGGTGGNAGGAGSSAWVRIEADVLSGSGGVSSGTGSANTTRTYTGRITAYSYDAAHRRVDTVQGADNVDATQAGAPTSDGGANIRSRVVYDADGHVIARYDPRAFKTSPPDTRFVVRIDFNADGQPVTQYVPRYDTSDPTASDLGLSTDQSSQCAANNTSGYYPSSVGVCVTSVLHDAVGNIVRTTLATATGSGSNRYIAFNYTDDNLLASQDTPTPTQASGGRVTAQSYLYDADGRRVLATDALGHQQKTVYTLDGLTSQQIAQPNGSITHQSTLQYDANGNQTSISSTVSSTVNQLTTYRYYSDGLRSDVIDGLNNDTRYTYDANGNNLAVYSPAAMAKVAPNASGTPTRYAYTADNLLLTTTTPVSSDGKLVHQTIYGYDRAGRKTSEDVKSVDSHPSPAVTTDAGTQTYSYFPDDREQSQSGRNGEAIAHTYDPAGNPVRITDSTSSITLSATYYLDARVRTVDDGARSTLYSYDGNGSPVGRADAVDGTSTQYRTTYQYGDAGLPMSMSSTITPRAATTWTYDLAGRAVSENDPNGQALTWSYNADDTMATQTFKTSSGATLGTWSYTYDGLSRITDQYFTGTGANGGTPVTGDFLYHYDAAGRLDSFTKNGQAATIGHDANGNRSSYVDPNDPQRAQVTYAYNADDSLASSTTPTLIQSFSYDAAGRTATEQSQQVVSGSTPPAYTCTTYQYDGFDRTTQRQALTPSGSVCPTGGRTVNYSYDGLDRQRSSTDTGRLVSLHYDGFSKDVAVETSSSNVDTAYVLATGGGRAAFGVQGGSPAPQYLTTDGQGNVAAVTDDAQSLKCTTRLDPYGTPVYSTPPSDKTNTCNTGSTTSQYFYRGSRRDASSGNYQFGSRSYDPSKGAFLTPDSYRSGSAQQDLSIGRDPLTRNTYSYVNGDPVNLVDLNGHDPWGRDLVADQKLVAQLNAAPTDHSHSHAFYQNHDPYLTQDQATNLNNQMGLINYQRQVAAEAAAKAAAADDGCHWAPWTWGHCAAFKTVVAIGAGIATFAGCEASTLGVGTAGCAVAGFAVGGAVNGALNCGGGQSELACAAKGGAAGLVGGVVFVATGGTGGGLAAGIIAGGTSAAASDATQQFLDKGSVDLKEVAVAGLTGAATAGAFRVGGQALSSARSMFSSGGGRVGSEVGRMLAGGPGAAVRNGPEFFPRLAVEERVTLGRLQEHPDFVDRYFEQSPHVGAEVVDDLGRSYDFMGTAAASTNWNPGRFFASIRRHLLKSNDFTVIDMSDFASEHAEAVRGYVSNLDPALRARIVTVGG